MLLVIDFLKLRGSFGILGNDRIGSFRFVSLMNGEGVYTFGGNQLVFGTSLEMAKSSVDTSKAINTASRGTTKNPHQAQLLISIPHKKYIIFIVKATVFFSFGVG